MPQSLLEIIKGRIRESGPITVADYMDLCLGHPDHGYYMTRDPLGAGGDFTTSPEISQLFGEMIGVWLADLWIKSGRPLEFTLLECGPGRGTLMADIMRATKGVEGFHAAARIALMEMSPVLKDAQSRALRGYDPYWIGDIARLEGSAPVFLVANEFLDALPIRQFIKRGGEWRERGVSVGGCGQLEFCDLPADADILNAFPQAIKGSVESGYFETSLVLNQFIKSVNILLKKQGGAALFIDYGHVRASLGDSLQAMKEHKFAGIFDTPGSCDLTAHVDFENIARIGAGDGMAVRGPVTQRAFLQELGVELRAAMLCAGANPVQAQEILSGLKRISDTAGMGSLFKVLALTSDPELVPEGFDG